MPSLDTPTCALTSTKVFNQRLGAALTSWCWSCRPTCRSAQGRFCQAEGTADVKTLSMMRSRNFARTTGC